MKLYFFYVYFTQAALAFTGIAQTLYLKDVLGLSVAEIAAFSALLVMPWTVKPLYGFLTDMLPLFGSHRKHYVVLANLMMIAGVWLVALGPTTYSTVVAGFLIQAIGIALNDVVCDGLVVAASKDENAGKLQSFCWSGNATGGIIGSLLSGFLLAHFEFREIFALAAFLPIGTILLSRRISEVGHVKMHAKETLSAFWNSLKSRKLWFIAFFFYLWNIAPNFGTPFYFYQKEVLGFADGFIGILAAITGVGMLLGSVSYGAFLSKKKERSVLFWTIVFGAISGAMTFLIKNQTSALIVAFVQGFAFFLGFMPILALAARHCPSTVGATVFALFASVINLSKAHSLYIGGYLYEPLGLNVLIVVSVVTTLIALPMLPFVTQKS